MAFQRSLLPPSSSTTRRLATCDPPAREVSETAIGGIESAVPQALSRHGTTFDDLLSIERNNSTPLGAMVLLTLAIRSAIATQGGE